MTAEKKKLYYPTLKQGDKIKMTNDSDIHGFSVALHSDGWKYRVANGYIIIVGRIK